MIQRTTPSTDTPRSEAEVRQRITEVEAELAKAVRRSHMTNLVGQLEALRWVVRDPSIFSGEPSGPSVGDVQAWAMQQAIDAAQKREV